MSTHDRAALHRLWDGIPSHKLREIVVEDAADGYVRIRPPATEYLRGGVGSSCHGSVLRAPVDTAALGADVAAESCVVKQDGLPHQPTVALLTPMTSWATV
jgi:hypothetical protein